MSVPSVPVAKDRLKALIISDRIQCTPDMIERLSNDLYMTLTKYMEINSKDFKIQITHSEIKIQYSKKTGEKN